MGGDDVVIMISRKRKIEAAVVTKKSASPARYSLWSNRSNTRAPLCTYSALLPTQAKIPYPLSRRDYSAAAITHTCGKSSLPEIEEDIIFLPHTHTHAQKRPARGDGNSLSDTAIGESAWDQSVLATCSYSPKTTLCC